ncbi:GNAT family N-acetyltransferase [bacterium]|nr:GNAT family N-acetyltransferase [bacterium]
MVERAKKSEYEKIQRFLESAYGHSYNWFPLSYPQVWKKNNTDFKNTFIIKEKGEIVSLVRIFPLPLILDGIEVNFAGIGAVATSYSHRGKGYMSALLQESFKEMKKQKFPLSILWGDRYRYKNFGYEVAGKKIFITITSRGLVKNKIESDKNTKRFQGEEKILEKIIKAYNHHPYRKKRTQKEFEERFKKVSSATYYLQKKNKFAYISISVETGFRIIESGGDERLVLQILKYIEERFGYSSFSLYYPDFEFIPELIVSAASSWEIKPEGMIKIIDLYHTLKVFSKKFSLIPENFPITFSIKNGESVIVEKKSGKVNVLKGKGKNEILLDEIDMVKFLFGTSFWELKGIKKEITDVLRSVLPINVFMWVFDHI